VLLGSNRAPGCGVLGCPEVPVWRSWVVYREHRMTKLSLEDPDKEDQPALSDAA